MRLGGPVNAQNPEEWVTQLSQFGYRAGTLPKSVGVEDREIQKAFVKEAEKADIIIAEVGAWSNPISTDENERKKAIQFCQERLAVADQVGAKCCVNIAGSKGKKWDGPHPDNMTQDTFTLIVDTVRTIIDAVKPKQTFYALEPMPWIFPYDIESYIRIMKAIDRQEFAVHLDPVNMITSIERYYSNTKFVKDCFQKLGPFIKSCHVKDISLQESFTVHLQETRPGTGSLDLAVFLEEAEKLSKDMPVLLEHLPSDEEYVLAANYVRNIAEQKGLSL